MMLNAFLRGGRLGEAEDFQLIENWLTSTVFERLSYLPDTTIAEILFSSWPDPCVPIGDLIECRFWPRWDDVLRGRQVEPDCIFKWLHRVLVIEAKRYDHANMQNAEQLAAEALAAHHRYERRGIWMLAVGGLREHREVATDRLRGEVWEILENQEDPPTDWLHFAAVSWYDLFQQIKQRLQTEDPAQIRLLRDIRKGLILHGLATESPGWLCDLQELRNRQGRIADESIEHFHW